MVETLIFLQYKKCIFSHLVNIIFGLTMLMLSFPEKKKMKKKDT